MVGPGGWATVAQKTRADQIQRRTIGRDKCENITDGKSKHPAQILEASVVHDGSGGRASFLSCELGGWDCQPFWDPRVDVLFLSQALSPFPPIVGTGKPAQFSPNLIAVGEPPLGHASTAWVVAGPGFFLSPLRKPYSLVPLSTDCSALCSSGAFWNHAGRFIHLLVSHMV